jgi:hypothetical protein
MATKSAKKEKERNGMVDPGKGAKPPRRDAVVRGYEDVGRWAEPSLYVYFFCRALNVSS